MDIQKKIKMEETNGTSPLEGPSRTEAIIDKKKMFARRPLASFISSISFLYRLKKSQKLALRICSHSQIAEIIRRESI